MKAISGTLDVDARYEGSISGAFQNLSKIKFKMWFITIHRFFTDSYTQWVNLDLDMSYDFKNIHVSHHLSSNALRSGQAKSKIYGIGTEEWYGGRGREQSL